jgi:phosphatidate cytidylyltransferase
VSAASAVWSLRPGPEPVTGAHSASKPGGRERVTGDLSLRVISSVALAPLAIGAAYLGGWVFLLFWLVAALGVLWEWNGLVAAPAARRITAVGGIALSAAALAVGQHWLALGAIVIGAACACAALLGRQLWTAVGVVYAACVVIPAVVLRADPGYGFVAIMVLFAVVWGTDIAAYFGGRLLGGPKLWPRVTPKKTWSGALVGAGVATLAGVGVAWTANLKSLAAVAAIGLVLSVASQAGDLFESGIKRRFGAKDASTLIPGHGGLMDRLDGFVAAALAAAVVGASRGGIEAPARGLLIW